MTHTFSLRPQLGARALRDAVLNANAIAAGGLTLLGYSAAGRTLTVNGSPADLTVLGLLLL